MSRFSRNCNCADCTAMYNLANKVYRQFVADRVPYCVAVNAAAIVMALAASNDPEDDESRLDAACDFARELLPDISAVH